MEGVSVSVENVVVTMESILIWASFASVIEVHARFSITQFVEEMVIVLAVVKVELCVNAIRAGLVIGVDVQTVKEYIKKVVALKVFVVDFLHIFYDRD